MVRVAFPLADWRDHGLGHVHGGGREGLGTTKRVHEGISGVIQGSNASRCPSDGGWGGGSEATSVGHCTSARKVGGRTRWMSQVRQPVRAEGPLEIAFGIYAFPSTNTAIVTIVAAKEQELMLVCLRATIVVEEPPACLRDAASNE